MKDLSTFKHFRSCYVSEGKCSIGDFVLVKGRTEPHAGDRIARIEAFHTIRTRASDTEEITASITWFLRCGEVPAIYQKAKEIVLDKREQSRDAMIRASLIRGPCKAVPADQLKPTDRRSFFYKSSYDGLEVRPLTKAEQMPKFRYDCSSKKADDKMAESAVEVKTRTNNSKSSVAVSTPALGLKRRADHSKDTCGGKENMPTSALVRRKLTIQSLDSSSDSATSISTVLHNSKSSNSMPCTSQTKSTTSTSHSKSTTSTSHSKSTTSTSRNKTTTSTSQTKSTPSTSQTKPTTRSRNNKSLKSAPSTSQTKSTGSRGFVALDIAENIIGQEDDVALFESSDEDEVPPTKKSNNAVGRIRNQTGGSSQRVDRAPANNTRRSTNADSNTTQESNETSHMSTRTRKDRSSKPISSKSAPASSKKNIKTLIETVSYNDEVRINADVPKCSAPQKRLTSKRAHDKDPFEFLDDEQTTPVKIRRSLHARTDTPKEATPPETEKEHTLKKSLRNRKAQPVEKYIETIAEKRSKSQRQKSASATLDKTSSQKQQEEKGGTENKTGKEPTSKRSTVERTSASRRRKLRSDISEKTSSQEHVQEKEGRRKTRQLSAKASSISHTDLPDAEIKCRTSSACTQLRQSARTKAITQKAQSASKSRKSHGKSADGSYSPDAEGSSTEEDSSSEDSDSSDHEVPVKRRQRASQSKKSPPGKATSRRSKSVAMTPSVPIRTVPVKDGVSELERARAELHISVVPDTLPCREEEFANIFSYVESKLDSGTGGCLYISGVPGTGKTATVYEVVRFLKSAAYRSKLPTFNFVEINGMKLTQPNQAYFHIYQSLTNKKVTSEHAATLLDKRFSSGTRDQVPTLLLVDELDLLMTRKQDVLYNLFDWPTKSCSKLIVLAIANTMDLPERVMINRVSSRLGLNRMTFQPYTYQQLETIVHSRLSGISAFEADAVQLASRKVAAVSGDARRALDICRRATEIAEQKSDSRVDMLHVDAALQEMFSSPKIQAIRSCSACEKMVLKCILAEFTRSGLEEATVQQIFMHVSAICALERLTTIRMCDLQQVFANLHSMKLVLLENSGSAMYQRIRLNVSQDDVRYALSEDNNA